MSLGPFGGFPPEGLSLLSELGRHDKEWFAQRREVYDRCVADPAKRFADAMGEELRATVSAGITAQPKVNGSISPINNDLRFRPDAQPYKDHLLFRFWEGRSKKTAATLFVRLSEETVGFASGIVPADIDRWRSVVASPSGEGLAGALDAIAAVTPRGLDLAGEELKRVPGGHDPDHPRADLLRRKSLQVRWSEPTPDEVHTPGFAEWCGRRLERCGALHAWFVANLG